ncbi:unnamed protein product [Peronospora belbahrii]|uniref:WW domain-containing protein n=1 Tax=Peronospora belbahrii TaxID=622444 RepID=A0ABN8DB93_9STRA|nr:unnamed protein product [Peronospora belbahrii]
MMSRGMNGATSGTLNERFIKCTGCKVNIPKDDMVALGKCTVCGRVYETVTTADGRGGSEVITVAFDNTGTTSITEVKKPKRKRWAVLTSKKGRTYYHNTETGEDRWDKPVDLDADAADNTFVPFKNDAVKKAVLREQMKLEATKMGVPMEVVAVTQHRLQHEDEINDPFTNMVVDRSGQGKNTSMIRAASPNNEAKAAMSLSSEEDAANSSLSMPLTQQPEQINESSSCSVM